MHTPRFDRAVLSAWTTAQIVEVDRARVEDCAITLPRTMESAGLSLPSGGLPAGMHRAGMSSRSPEARAVAAARWWQPGGSPPGERGVGAA